MSQVVALPSMQERSAKYFVQTESPLIREFGLLATASDSVERLRGLVVSLAFGGYLTLLRSSSSRLSVNTWPVVSLSDLGPDFQNGASSRGDVGGVATTVIRLADIIAGEISLANPRVLPIKAPDCEKYKLKQGDILIIRVNGSAELVGRFIVCRSDMEAIHCDHFIRMRFDTTVVYPEYLRLVGDSVSVRTKIASLFISTAGQKTVNQAHIGSIKIVLLPLAEQHRIVARVEELMKLCDALKQNGRLADEQHARLTSTLFEALASSESAHALDKNWQHVAGYFDLLLDRPEAIEDLEQTILQLAVRGLLVHQDAAEEPASELLERIAAYRQSLLRHKLKPKRSIEIDEAICPFALPFGWVWTTWEMVALQIGDIDHKMPREVTDGIPYISPRDFTEGNGIDFAGAKKISETDYKELASKIRPERGDLIYPRYGTIGKVRLVEVDSRFLASYSCAVIKCLKGYINSDYQFIVSISKLIMNQAAAATNKTTQPNVGLKSIKSFLFPLPPLAEQHRIVARVEELRRLCADLRQRLTQAGETQSRLADALVAEIG